MSKQSSREKCDKKMAMSKYASTMLIKSSKIKTKPPIKKIPKIIYMISHLIDNSEFNPIVGTNYHWDSKSINDIGTKTYWDLKQGPGSHKYWLSGDGPGSQRYWFNGTDEGSKCYWENGTGPGSLNYWNNGYDLGSEHFWDHGHLL